MTKFQTTADCKCGYRMLIQFSSKKSFVEVVIPIECEYCGSELAVHVKPGLFRRQCRTRTVLMNHTQRLLDIFAERQTHAQNH